MIRTEILQYRATGDFKKHFWNFWNLVDLFALSLTSVLSTHWLLNWIFDITWVDVSDLRLMAAFASFLLIAKIFDWLRLFESTAFYVQLLRATLINISSFMLLFFVAILLFGLPLSMFNQSRSKTNEEEQIISEQLYMWLEDVIYNQYLLALGEFQTYEAYT